MKWLIPVLVMLFGSPVFAADCADNVAVPAAFTANRDVTQALETLSQLLAKVEEAEAVALNTFWSPITRREEMLKEIFADYGPFVLSDSAPRSLTGLARAAYAANPELAARYRLDNQILAIRSTWGLWESDPAAGILREDIGVFLKNVRAALGLPALK